MNLENNRGISRNVLKFVAITTIVIGHFFLYTLTTLNFIQKLNVPWRGMLCYICFMGPPIFMFFISEGFRYTRSKVSYGKRLLIFALITQVAFAITTQDGLGFDVKRFFFTWNVFFALLIGFVDLCILNTKHKTLWKVLEVLATLALSYFTKTEWWVFGPLMIIAFYYLREQRVLKFVVATILTYLTFALSDCDFGGAYQVTLWTKSMPYIMIYAMIGIALVSFCYYGKNGKKNKFMQYFFYVFYPLHLILIDIVILLAK